MARVFKVEGKWALSADALQWILCRYRGGDRYGVAFVSTTKDILARCMREKGVEPHTAEKLLGGLPATFKEFKASQEAFWGHGWPIHHSKRTTE
jgi:hypothetical protein